MTTLRSLATFTTLTVLFAAAALAQSDRGTITGTVADPTGALVPGAEVMLKRPDTGAAVETQSTVTGNFTLASLPVGEYELSVDAAGFKKAVRGGLRVQVAQTMRLDIELEIGSSAETVTVTAEAPVLRTENAEQSMNVRGDKINELPINFGGGGSRRRQPRRARRPTANPGSTARPE